MDAPVTPSRADAALAAALQVLAPLVTLLLHEGVTYPQLASALKGTFLDAGARLLRADGPRMTDSGLSALTGVHRKDVREWRAVGRPRPQARALSVAMAVFTRWLNDPQYRDRRGRPKTLNRSGGAASFEALAASTSNDVHARTVLQELLRLGIVERVPPRSKGAAEQVRVCLAAFVPAQGVAEMLQLLSENVGDHAAAAVHNVLASGPPMLEQSVFVDEITDASADQLAAAARKAWSRVSRDLVREAIALGRSDAGQPEADHRLRVGMYFYRGPQRPEDDGSSRA